jgi:hypothetical protein
MVVLEAKTKPARYPMGTIKQARNTLSRLTRDLLNGKIDREKYRSACYGLSVLCGLFRLETPIEAKVTAETKNTLDAIFNMTPEQRHQRIDDLTKKMFPGYEENKQADMPEPDPVQPDNPVMEPVKEAVKNKDIWRPIGIGSRRQI